MCGTTKDSKHPKQVGRTKLKCHVSWFLIILQSCSNFKNKYGTSIKTDT